MGLLPELEKISHADLEEMHRLLEDELARRWKAYEAEPELFRAVVAAWNDNRLENFISIIDMERQYSKQENNAPSPLYEIVREEWDKREKDYSL